MTKAELKAKNPKINFIKTKWLVEKPDPELLKEAFIPNEDMPEIKAVQFII